MRNIFLALLVATTAGCGESSTGPTPGVSSITLAIGQAAVVPDTTLSVTFREVVRDSRCPVDVTCIQAGEALAAFDVTTGSATHDSTSIRPTPDVRPSSIDIGSS